MFSNISQAIESKFIGGDINVFWDVEDSSILNDLNAYLTKLNIQSALADKGYFGRLSIYAFVDDNNTLSEASLDESLTAVIRINFLPKGNKYETAHSMLVRILSWALKNRGQLSSTLIILSENIKEDKKVTGVVEALKEKYNYNIFFEEPGSLPVRRGGTLFHESGSSQTQEVPYCGYFNKSRKDNK